MRVVGWPVTKESGPRPAGAPDRCFYCAMPIGEQHTRECAIRSRSVVVRVTVDYVVSVPEDWTAGQIEFHRNESSWCASNMVAELENAGCICGLAKSKYLREASEEETAAAGIDLRSA